MSCAPPRLSLGQSADVLVLIFAHVPRKKLLSWQRVCKQWRAFISARFEFPISAGFDLGTSNFADFYGLQRTDPHCPIDELPCIFDFVAWGVSPLPGDKIFEWIESLHAHLSQKGYVKAGHVQNVYIEQQLAAENPVMYALSAGLAMYWNTLRAKAPGGRAWPLQIESVGASSKFGTLMVRTPEGLKNKPHRKKLSVRIVVYMLKSWVARKLVHRRWLDMFANAAKADDLADALFMAYTEELHRRKIQLSWRALQKLFGSLTSAKPFCPEGACPLEMTAEGTRRFEVYLRKLERAKLKAQAEVMLEQKREEKRRLKEEKSKPAPPDPKQSTLSFGTKKRKADEIAPATAAAAHKVVAAAAAEEVDNDDDDDFVSVKKAAHQHRNNAAVRKERGALAPDGRTPLVHLTEQGEEAKRLQARTLLLLSSDDDGKEEEQEEEAEPARDMLAFIPM